MFPTPRTTHTHIHSRESKQKQQVSLLKAVAGCQIGIADLKVKDGRAAAAEALTQLVWWSPKFNSQEDEHIKNVRIHGRSIFFVFTFSTKALHKGLN